MSAAGEGLREAIARHRAGDHAAAEGAYRAHLRQFPGDPSALHFLGLLRNHQGRNSEGIPLMLAALEADPGYVDAWSNLAIAYYQERDLVRSEKCSRKAIELSPDFANAWVNLALTLRAQDSLQEALIALGRALELNPRQRSTALYYGQLLYRLSSSTAAGSRAARMIRLHNTCWLLAVEAVVRRARPTPTSDRPLTTSPSRLTGAWNCCSTGRPNSCMRP